MLSSKLKTQEKMNNKNFKWYALRVISGKEKKTMEYLEKLLKSENVKDYVSDVILPAKKVYKVRSGKKYVVDKNFFPGYLMVEASMNGEVQHMIEKSPNVIHFLSSDGKPTPLKDIEVKRILGKLDEVKDNLSVDEPYVVGEYVEIVGGPFETFNGNVVSVDTEKKRLKVVVNIFGRETPVDLDFTQVARVE
jgi:transcriptional antiterminator NusG